MKSLVILPVCRIVHMHVYIYYSLKAVYQHNIVTCAFPGDQLRLGSRRRERSYRERRRDGQLSAHTRRGAGGFGKILVQPVERRRVQRGRARPER